MNSAADLRSRLEAALENRIPRALTPPERSNPEMAPTGIASVDTVSGGIPVGCLTELCGASSSGRTSVLLSMIAECIKRNETCALVDANDAFDPQSAVNAGVDLARLLWIRCNPSSPRRHEDTEKKGSGFRSVRSKAIKSSVYRITSSPDSAVRDRESTQIEQALKATDLLLQAGGFGLVVLDLGDMSVTAARRIPLTTWFRFRRAVENTSTMFIVVEQQPHAKSCASLVLDFTAQQASWREAAQEAEGIVGTNSDSRIEDAEARSMVSRIPTDGVAFRVTSQGVAIPFDKPMASSFETPQRWISPRARLLNTVHVHLQVTRSRMVQKFPVKASRPLSMLIHHGDTETRSNAI